MARTNQRRSRPAGPSRRGPPEVGAADRRPRSRSAGARDTQRIRRVSVRVRETGGSMGRPRGLRGSLEKLLRIGPGSVRSMTDRNRPSPTPGLAARASRLLLQRGPALGRLHWEQEVWVGVSQNSVTADSHTSTGRASGSKRASQTWNRAGRLLTSPFRLPRPIPPNARNRHPSQHGYASKEARRPGEDALRLTRTEGRARVRLGQVVLLAGMSHGERIAAARVGVQDDPVPQGHSPNHDQEERDNPKADGANVQAYESTAKNLTLQPGALNGAFGSSGGRAALHLRVSTEDQDLAGQERELRVECNRRGWEVVAVYAERVSGTGRVERKEYEQLLRDARKPDRPWNHLLVTSLDRWSREERFTRAIDTIFDLGKAGVLFHSLKEPYLDTPTGAAGAFDVRGLLLSVTSLVAGYESRRRSERVLVAIREL
jgi:Resolvase, N terminal domain